MAVTVLQAGIDTWSPAWYVAEGSPAERAMRALATVPAARSKLLPEPIAKHRVGWFPSSRLLFAEGHPGGDRLASPDALPLVLDPLTAELANHGIRLPVDRAHDGCLAGSNRPGFAGIRRLDATCDLRFDSSAEGLACLAGVAALGLARAQTAVRYEPGRGAKGALETVAFYGHGGRKMLARWYDKGVESNLAPWGDTDPARGSAPR